MSKVRSGWGLRIPVAQGTGLEVGLSTLLFAAALISWLARPGRLSGLLVSALGLVWLGLLFFFRDPERPVPSEVGAYLSPADGKVVSVEPVEEPLFLGDRAVKVAIFLSLFDVHVNRAPVAGVVEFTRHVPGKFLQAFRPEASLANEHNLIGIADGEQRILIKQIAGILARRVVCRVDPGDRLAAGERLGMIKFGSRVEVFLPMASEVLVAVGDRVRGGKSVIARRREAAEGSGRGEAAAYV
jgi:phosphatidylserine decarboxylase